ncbi:hypothetical protein MSAN_01735900 [Mycena sanguinolenta]|uniref:DUF6699 domain-containing protein n=1 Tax=Mycena sanguinolenta TaxID=230812 RepID=A0A8H6XWE3_9AGAR|nr:hypothetical protein MSAN_01735900 [Mycena sanguinolenta]
MPSSTLTTMSSTMSDLQKTTGARPFVSASRTSYIYVAPHGGSMLQRKSALPHGPRLQPVALPPQITGVTTVTLNPMLRFGSIGTRIDVNFASISVMIDPVVATQWATFPGLPSITLLSSHLPWVITAHASGEFVVVGDVLRAIRQALAIQITEEQVLDRVQRPDEDTNVVIRRGAKRQKVYERGMTRLYLLEGKTRFAGLSESAMGGEVWMLNFV